MLGAAAAKRVLPGGEVVHVERDDAVRAHRFEQLGDVTRGDGVARLRLAVFARVGEIGHDRADARGRSVFQCAEKEQQAAQLVVHGFVRVAVEGMHDIDIAAAHVHEGARLVLAVFECALFVFAQCDAQLRGNARAELARRTEREQFQVRLVHHEDCLASIGLPALAALTALTRSCS
jgi:hypothetical protein